MEVNIVIEGKEIASFVSLEIEQAFYEHHRFELVLRQDILIRQEPTIETTREYIGKFMAVGFGRDGREDNFFKGLITGVTFSQDKGAWGNLILKGYSATYLLESGNHYASFSERSLGNIAEELCSNLAVNDMRLVFKPKYTSEIPYCCQYNESNYAFLKRLAAEYGEWLYADGRSFYFGKPEAEEPIKLNYGEDVENMRFSLKLSPYKHTLYSYIAEEDEVVTTGHKDARGTPFQNKAIEETDNIYRKGVAGPLPGAGSENHLRRASENRQGKSVAQTVVLQADGDNTRVLIGSKIELHIAGEDLDGNRTTEITSFLVTRIKHSLTGNGTYHHTFEGIPANSEHIPVEVPKVTAESQVAIVKNNNDPKGFGRVQVQMPWQKGESTDWIRVLSPDAGSSKDVSRNRGFVFVPEVNDQVIIGFEHNHPDRPFVLGSVFHGKNGAGGGKENNIKSIITRSGHKIELNDTKGEELIIISDKTGNEIRYDTKKKSLFITSTADLEFNAKNIKLTAEENIELKAGKKIQAASEKDVEILAEGELALQSEKDTTVKSGAGITLEATKDAILNGQNVTAEGKVKVTITGKQTKLSGKMTALEGASGKIEIS